MVSSNRLILPIVIALAASLATPASADPVELEGDASELEIASVNADVLMPSLEELLGEPVDTLGFIDDMAALKSEIVDYAKNFLGIRYRLGATGPKAFDCSGFTSYVFRNFGYSLDRVSRSQGSQGVEVDLRNAEVGDLIFFSGRRSGKGIGHVGIVIDVDKETGALKFIHASSGKGIRIENFPDGGYYNKRFISVRRILGSPEFDLAQN